MVKAKQIRGKTAKPFYGAAMSEPEPLGLLDRATPKGSLSISVRQHWMALIRPPIIFSALLAGVFAWAAANPQATIAFLHVNQAWAPIFLKILQSFFDFRFFFVVLPCMFAICSALWTLGQWQFTSFRIDHYGLTYRMGPFIQNTIPLRAIQDIRQTATPLGLIFGYGTLVIDAGREEETLTFVPHVDQFVAALRR